MKNQIFELKKKPQPVPFATPHENLMALELLCDFVEKIVPIRVFLKNLTLTGVDTSNKRLWVLRENLGYNEAEFARLVNIRLKRYRRFEKNGVAIPLTVLRKIEKRTSIPLEWLRCMLPMLPIPIGGNRSGNECPR
jgi:hypothetical protein